MLGRVCAILIKMAAIAELGFGLRHAFPASQLKAGLLN
jgi:hypothetical protein